MGHLCFSVCHILRTYHGYIRKVGLQVVVCTVTCLMTVRPRDLRRCIREREGRGGAIVISALSDLVYVQRGG